MPIKIKYYYIFSVLFLCNNIVSSLREYSKRDIHRLRYETENNFYCDHPTSNFPTHVIQLCIYQKH